MMQKITQLEDDIVMINSFHKKFVFVIYDDQNNTYKHTYIYIYIYIYIFSNYWYVFRAVVNGKNLQLNLF